MKTNSLSAWILAVRPYSLGNSVILVLIGSALAWTDRGFHWLPAVLCLAFALLMQCTANLVNDLWDFLKGADQPDRLGPDRAFAKGYITLGAMKAGIAGFTLAACAAGGNSAPQAPPASSSPGSTLQALTRWPTTGWATPQSSSFSDWSPWDSPITSRPARGPRRFSLPRWHPAS